MEPTKSPLNPPLANPKPPGLKSLAREASGNAPGRNNLAERPWDFLTPNPDQEVEVLCARCLRYDAAQIRALVLPTFHAQVWSFEV